MIDLIHTQIVHVIKIFRVLMFKPSKFKHQILTQGGFTIIELLVVITLVGLVSGVGIFSLVNYGNTQTIEQSVSNVKGILDEAKFNAISSVVVETNELGESVECNDSLLSSYRVDIIPSTETGDRFVLYMNCEGTSETVKSYTLPSELELGVNTTCDEITYQAVDVNASASPVLPCDIEIEGFGESRIITVDILGNITITNNT